MNYTYVIIDDESKIRDLIKNIIQDNLPELEIIGTADSVLSGLKLINQKKPQLIFMDIELPDGTGFDILESISDTNHKIIFISAFNDYAVRAFKYSAVDYLLKPINTLEFIKSVNTAVNSIDESNHYNVLIENLNSEYPTKLAVQIKDGVFFVDVNDIIYIQGEGRYSTFFVNHDKKFVEAKNLSYYEEILNEQIFYRLHKSYLINLNYVKAYKKKEGGLVEMSNNAILSVSRSKKEDFLKKMADL